MLPRMGSEVVGESVDWGGGTITFDAAERFAARVPVTPAERGRIARTLYDFPMECQVRGMFFQGLVDTVTRTADRTVCDRLLTESGVHTRFIPFVLMPHRDFYKLYFLAAATLFPRMPLEHGFERIAEDFYPTFKDSMVGRTLSAFIGKDPFTVLDRLAQAAHKSVMSPEVRERMSGDGAEPIGSSPSEFQSYLGAEIAKWRKVVASIGLSAK